MSKIGKLPIKISEGVLIEIDGSKVKITGPKGSYERIIPSDLRVIVKEKNLLVEEVKKTSDLDALHGTYRSILANAVKGVSEGWTKVLELVGTGFRAEVNGDELSLSIGYSHPVKIKAPEGIKFKVEKTDITVEGYDKELLGLICSRIRSFRPPEPYKGKGIRYKNEVVRRKAGKAAKTGGTQ